MNVTVGLSPVLGAFVQQQVAAGAYATAGDVVVAGLEHLRRRAEDRAELEGMMRSYGEDIENGAALLPMDALIDTMMVHFMTKRMQEEGGQPEER